MSTWVIVLLVVVGAAAVFALAWWSSGRSRGVEHQARAAGERSEAEARALKHHRPNSSNPIGPI